MECSHTRYYLSLLGSYKHSIRSHFYTPPVHFKSLITPALPKSPLTDPKACEIIAEFAASDMSLPQAEEQLKVHLGSQYIKAEWRDVFKAVMDAENDTLKALESIKGSLIRSSK